MSENTEKMLKAVMEKDNKEALRNLKEALRESVLRRIRDSKEG